MKYSSYLGSALTSHVDALVKRDNALLSLRDELALAHLLAGEAARIWSRTFEDCDLQPGQLLTIRNAAGAYLEHTLDFVARMTVAAKRVEENGSHVDIATLHTILTQVCATIEDELSMLDGPSLQQTLRAYEISGGTIADRIAERVRNELLTADAVNSKGTNLTPDTIQDQILAMDAATCPAPPPQISRAS